MCKYFWTDNLPEESNQITVARNPSRKYDFGKKNPAILKILETKSAGVQVKSSQLIVNSAKPYLDKHLKTFPKQLK